MLGFSTFSEVPLSQATTSLAANAFAIAIASTGFISTLDYDAEANYTITSVPATFSLDIEFDAQASTDVVNVLSSLSIEDVVSFGEANHTPSAAVVAFSVDDLDYVAEANLTLVAATMSFDLDAVEYDADASTDATSVAATFNTLNDLEYAAAANTTLSSALFAGAAYDVDFDAKANTSLSAIANVIDVDAVDFKAEARIITPEAVVSFNIEDFTSVTGEANTSLSANLLEFASLELEDVTGIIFNFQPFADAYDRARTVYLVTYDTNRTVHITPENRTVYIEKVDGNNTVYIAA